MRHPWYAIQYLTPETPVLMKHLLDTFPGLRGVDQRFGAPGGSGIMDCCRIAVQIAQVIAANVVFTFNDVCVVAAPGDNWVDLCDAWYVEAYGRKAEDR